MPTSLTDLQRAQIGSAFSVDAYGRPVTLPPGNWSLLDSIDRPSGYQAKVYVDTTAHRIIFTNTGTNFTWSDVRDEKAWPDAILGAHSQQWNDMLTAAKSINDLIDQGGSLEGYEVVTTGHSWGEAMAQAQTWVFGWSGTGYDGPGAKLLVDSQKFTQLLQNLNITPVQGNDFISFDTAGLGPFGGGLVGSIGVNISGTRVGLVTTDGSTASGLADIMATATGFILGGPAGAVFGHAAASLYIGVQIHDIQGINAAIQDGRFVIAAQPGTIPVPLPPPDPTFQPPVVINDSEGNVISTVLDSSGQVVTNVNGNPIFRLELNSGGPTPLFKQSDISLISSTENSATYAVTVDGQQKSLEVVSSGSGQTYDAEQGETVQDLSGGNNTINASGANATVIASDDMINVGSGATVAVTGPLNQIYAGNNSTVQATVFDSTLVTAAGAGLSVLGHNNNLILGTGTTVDMLGDNNTVLTADLQGLTIHDQGVGNQVVSPQGLPPDTQVHIVSDQGFDATVNLNDVVVIANGGLTGGSFDGTPFGPGPDPEIDGGGDPDPNPDPLINGHAFLIPGGLQIIAGSGDNSIQGGLEKNVIIGGRNGDILHFQAT